MGDVKAVISGDFSSYLRNASERDPTLNNIPDASAISIADRAAFHLASQLEIKQGYVMDPENAGESNDAIQIAIDRFVKQVEVMDLESGQIPLERWEVLGEDAAREVISYFRWHQAVSPYITSSQINKELQESGASWSAVEMVEQGRVVALPGSSGNLYFPTWQFKSGNLEPKEIVEEIISIFRHRSVDNYESALISWAATPQPELNGHAPRDVINDKSRKAFILTSATSLARRLDS